MAKPGCDPYRSQYTKCPAPPDLKLQVMLDSGAHSAWSKGVVLDIEKYARFMENTPGFATRVNLDVVPGRRNCSLTSSMIEDAATQSWKNYQWLTKRGFSVLPVFHTGERFYWLDKMLGEGIDYVGLGGIVSDSRARRVRWLDKVFTHITDSRGIPYLKTHGFGVSDFQIMRRYPWFSCDSASWMLSGAMGQGWCGSTRVSLGRKLSSAHVSMMSESEQHHITQNLDVKRLSESWSARLYHQAQYYLQTTQAIATKPFLHSNDSLFRYDLTPRAKSTAKLWSHLTFIFVVPRSSDFSSVLNMLGVSQRLLSYNELRTFKQPEATMQYYFNQGLFPSTQQLVRQSRRK